MTLLDRLVAEGKNRLYIAGEWRDASDGRTIDVLDPATEDQIATVASGSPDDMLDAVAAADEAGPAWAATSPRHKAQVLRRAFDLMLEREAGDDRVGDVRTGAELIRGLVDLGAGTSGAPS